MKSRLGERFTLLFESAAHLLDAAISFGLLSGAAIAIAIGQFLRGGVLAMLAHGAFLRFKRGARFTMPLGTSSLNRPLP